MFGALLDLFAASLACRNDAALPDGVDVRMMDFALFGEAVGLALGKAPGDFTRAYHENRSTHAQDIAQGDLMWEPLNAMLDGFGGAWARGLTGTRRTVEPFPTHHESQASSVSSGSTHQRLTKPSPS